MQNQTKAPAKARRAIKAAAPVAEQAQAVAAPVAEKAPELTPRIAALSEHDKAGFTGGNYAGLSKTRNGGVTKAANLATSKATARDFASLTPRMLSTLRDLAARYAKADFPLIGIDRGQLAIFLNSGYITDAGNGRGVLKYGKAPEAKADANGKLRTPPFFYVPDTFLS